MFQRYLKALGMSRTAQVKKDARVGEAEARRDATIRVSFLLLLVTNNMTSTAIYNLYSLRIIVEINVYKRV